MFGFRARTAGAGEGSGQIDLPSAEPGFEPGFEARRVKMSGSRSELLVRLGWFLMIGL